MQGHSGRGPDPPPARGGRAPPVASNPSGQAPRNSAQPVCGVHVKYLRSLANDHPDCLDQDIVHIVNDHIKPLTKTMSFAEYAQSRPELRHLVKPTADFFISYAWKYTLRTILSALAKVDGFIWMDFLVVNQNMSNPVVQPEALKTVFGTALSAIGKVLVIVAPWNEPINVQRIWCVFELFVTVDLKIPFELLFAGEDKERFQQTMVKGANSTAFYGVFGKIDVAKATASVQADCDAILKLVQEFGEVRVNNVVMQGLKDWLVNTALGFGYAEDTEEGVMVMNSLGHLHQSLGNLDEALLYFQRALRGSEKVNNALLHSVVLNNTGQLLHTQGKYAESEPYFTEALAFQKQALGDEDSLVAQTVNNLAGLRQFQGRNDEAELLYREAVAIKKKALGARHSEVATCLNNLAGLLFAKGDLIGALQTSREALDINVEALGPDHHSTNICRSWVAASLKSQGKLSEAAVMFEQILLSYRKALDDNHPHVAQTLNNLAEVYRAQSQFLKAEAAYKESIAIFARLKLEGHQHEAMALHNLAELYRAQARCSEAEPLYLKSLAIFKAALGENNATLALALNNYAGCLSAQGKQAEAKRMGLEALRIAEHALGANHPSTQDYRRWWGA